MKSGGARGVLAGWIVFLALTAVAALTPARLPVLRFAGLEAAVIRLEARAAVTAEARDAVARHRAEWHRLHGHLSPFGLIAFAQDVWPWLLGLGVALPLLGGLIGVQTGAQTNAQTGTQGPRSARAPRPLTPSAPSDTPAPVSSVFSREDEPAAPTRDSAPRASADPAPSFAESPPQERPEEPPPSSPPATSPTPPVRPPDPAAWDWKVRPAARPSARPKPPAVESPNAREERREQ